MALVMNDKNLKKSQEFDFDIFYITVMQIAKYSLSKALNRIKLIDIGAYKTKIEL